MKKLTSALFLIGATSIASQIIIIRGLLVVFSGNELSIGIILANWLLWTGIGSWAGSRFTGENPLQWFVVFEVIYSFLISITLIAIKVIRLLPNISTGEIFGIVPIWFYSFIILSVFCSIGGFLFVLGCRAYKSIGKVYIIEALGSGFGGMFVSLFLLRFMPPLAIAWMLSVANIAMALFLYKEVSRKYSTPILFCLLISLLSGVCGYVYNFDNLLLEKQWPGYRIVNSTDSIYGNITVTERKGHFNFYYNGLLSYSTPDKFSAEESVHIALLQHKAPKDVLLIGGGSKEVLGEILKYSSIQFIDYVELDPRVIKIADSLFHDSYTKLKNNSKINIYINDGRRFLKTTKKKFDVIIVNLPDPVTAQINRFYTKEFFLQAYEHLRPSGVCSFSVSSQENYISTILGEFLNSIYSTLKSVFPEVVVMPGEKCYFFGGREGALITDDYNILEQRLETSGIKTKYIRDYYLQYSLSKDRKQTLKDVFSCEKSILNTDSRPVSYYFNLMHWSTYFSSHFKKVFMFFKQMKLWHFCLPFVLLLLYSFFFRSNGFRKNNRYVLFPIFTSGISEIGFQIVSILSFQVIYGYVYYKLGFIITSFMIGLAIGGYLMNRFIPQLKNEQKTFKNIQIAMTIYPLILAGLFIVFAKTQSSSMSWLGENVLLPFLPIIPGIVGGAQFTLGNNMYLKATGEVGKTAGVTYGIDLLGSCVGALFISAFILPILGIIQTCLVMVSLNLFTLILILRPNLPEADTSHPARSL